MNVSSSKAAGIEVIETEDGLMVSIDWQGGSMFLHPDKVTIQTHTQKEAVDKDRFDGSLPIKMDRYSRAGRLNGFVIEVGEEVIEGEDVS